MSNNNLRVGIAGLGTVGCGVVRSLQEHGQMLAERCGRDIELAAVCARNKMKDRGVDFGSAVWFEDARQLAASGDIDVFVELIGGEDGVALESVDEALRNGRHVVTANKAMLARHGLRLAKLAEDNGVALNYEAAAAGAIPIVKTLRESLAGNAIERVYGILNGTCNYILTRMEAEGRDFADVLAEAQRLGYAEADPAADIGGFDTAHKLALLTTLAFGTEVDFNAIYIEGIERITAADLAAADEQGYRIKLLGVAVKSGTGIEQRVHPTMVPKHSAIAEINGVFNAVMIEGDFAGEMMLMGRGAGEKPTSSAVVGDIADIASGRPGPVFGRPVTALTPYVRARMKAHEGGYYVRLNVYDRPGIMASVAARMAEHHISLESIMQRSPESEPAKNGEIVVTVILITHETTEQAVRQALAAIEADGTVIEKPQMIRIERT